MLQPLKHNITLQALKILFFILAPLFVLIVLGSLTGTNAQVPAKSFTGGQSTAQATEEPPFRQYKGVQIGMTAEEVRKILGEPKELGNDQFFYLFSEKETAQILFDAQKKVQAISIDYLGADSGAPACKAVLGAEVQPQTNGAVYKLIRYPKYGYWVSYNRTAGDTPIVTVTIQKQK
jgi:outer membrane protein assembly factor BamE (lipoprotein component of BamABCDE complex)